MLDADNDTVPLAMIRVYVRFQDIKSLLWALPGADKRLCKKLKHQI